MVLQKDKTIKRFWKLKKHNQKVRQFAQERAEKLEGLFDDFPEEMKSAALTLAQTSLGVQSVNRALMLVCEIAENKQLIEFLENLEKEEKENE